MQALVRRAGHGGILLRAVRQDRDKAEIARALVVFVEQQLDHIQIAVKLREQQQLHDLDGAVVQTVLEDGDLLAEAVEAVHDAQSVACERVELRLRRLVLLRPQPDHELVRHVMIQTGMHRERGLPTVWAFDPEAGKILHLCPQLGISVDIDMVDDLIVVLGLTMRTGNYHSAASPPCSTARRADARFTPQSPIIL